MNNTLIHLNNYLFEQLERINDESLSDEELEKQIKKAEVINKTAENIIKNNETALKAVNIASEYGYIVPDNIRSVLGIKPEPKRIAAFGADAERRSGGKITHGAKEYSGIFERKR